MRRKSADELKKSYRPGHLPRSLATLQHATPNGSAARGNEVLHELGMRTGVDDLRVAGSAILIQADKFGSPASPKRCAYKAIRCAFAAAKQMAEEKAAKTAVKLIFPLVIFIFPGHLRRAGRPGRDHDGSRDVPRDERRRVSG